MTDTEGEGFVIKDRRSSQLSEDDIKAQDQAPPAEPG